jgi:hypothetical protein
MTPRIATATLALLLLPALSPAEPYVFTRVGQSTGYQKGDFAFSYSMETKYSLHEHVKSDASSGGGGGLGGQRDYLGVNHRLQAAYGVTDLLTASVTQTLKQTDIQDLSMGVLVGELRLNLNAIPGSLLKRLPLDMSAYFASRARIDARRQSSVVMGLGVFKRLNRLALFADVGFETTIESGEQENGLRYQVGCNYQLLDTLGLSAEAWGAMVWPNYSVFQQDHHAGPSLKLKLTNFWLGINAGVGMKERPRKIFIDFSGMLQLGMGF